MNMFKKIVSTPTSSASERAEGLHEQHVNNIKHDMVNYAANAAAAEKAGLK